MYVCMCVSVYVIPSLAKPYALILDLYDNTRCRQFNSSLTWLCGLGRGVYVPENIQGHIIGEYSR